MLKTLPIPGGRTTVHPPSSTSRLALLPLAGFQVIIYGRFWVITEGIVLGGGLSPARIGRSLQSSARPKHGIKRGDRMLGNPKMKGDRLFLFLAIAHRLLHGAERPVILVDWTQGCGTHVALVAAVPIGGRALPIYIEVHPLKKLGNAAVEERFLVALKAIVPPACRCIIVSDAGFKGPFFSAVRDQGWDFLGRVRGTTKAVSLPARQFPKSPFTRRHRSQSSTLERLDFS